MISIKKEPKEVGEDIDDEEEANIPPPPEFGSVNLIQYSTEQSHATRFPVGSVVWANVKSDGAHLSWNEGVVDLVLMDIMTRETVYRVKFPRDHGDGEGIIKNDGVAAEFQNLWERQLSFAIGSTVKIQSSSDTNKWSSGTVVFQNPGPPDRRTYAVRVGASSRSIELKVSESRMRYPKTSESSIAKANVSRGESEMQTETEGVDSEVVTAKDGSEISSLGEACQSAMDKGGTEDDKNPPVNDEMSESKITTKRGIEGPCTSTGRHCQTEGGSNDSEKPPPVVVEESSVRSEEAHLRQDIDVEKGVEDLMKSTEDSGPMASFVDNAPSAPTQKQPDARREDHFVRHTKNYNEWKKVRRPGDGDTIRIEVWVSMKRGPPMRPTKVDHRIAYWCPYRNQYCFTDPETYISMLEADVQKLPQNPMHESGDHMEPKTASNGNVFRDRWQVVPSTKRRSAGSMVSNERPAKIAKAFEQSTAVTATNPEKSEQMTIAAKNP